MERQARGSGRTYEPEGVKNPDLRSSWTDGPRKRKEGERCTLSTRGTGRRGANRKEETRFKRWILIHPFCPTQTSDPNRGKVVHPLSNPRNPQFRSSDPTLVSKIFSEPVTHPSNRRRGTIVWTGKIDNKFPRRHTPVEDTSPVP